MPNSHRLHDIIGRLTAVRSFAKLIKNDLSADKLEKIDFYCDIILKSTKELEVIVEEMEKESKT